MMVVFSIKEINCLVVSLFHDLVRPLSCLCWWYQVFGCAISLVFGIATKASMPLPKIIHHVVVGARRAKLFSNEIFSLNSVLGIVRPMVSF